MISLESHCKEMLYPPGPWRSGYGGKVMDCLGYTPLSPQPGKLQQYAISLVGYRTDPDRAQMMS